MPRRRNCYDNAVMKGFFSTVKSELGECFDNHGKAKAELSDDFKVLY
jgi:transposase InsO family protein